MTTYTINWKAAAKYFYQQFLLWVKAYNEVADVHMIAESWSGCSPSSTHEIIVINGSIPSKSGEL